MRTRKRKLMAYLALIPLCLAILWLCADRPLPARWQYRLTEQAYFLPPKEIFCVYDRDTLLSRDQNHVYFYHHGKLHRSTLDAPAWFVEDTGPSLAFYAYEPSGQAVLARLDYTVTSDIHGLTLQYHAEAPADQEAFRLPLERQYQSLAWEDAVTPHKEAEITHMDDIYQRFLDPSSPIRSTYTLHITFWNASGQLVSEIQESGESHREN